MAHDGVGMNAETFQPSANRVLKNKEIMTHALILRALPRESHQDAMSVVSRCRQSNLDSFFESSNEVMYICHKTSKSILVMFATNATGVAD